MKSDKEKQAYDLYFQSNLSQLQIAKLLDVDRRTIYNWMKEGNWQQLKKSAYHIPSKIAEQLYYMMANMNQEILSRQHQPYPLTHEVTQIKALATSIRYVKNRQTINESLESFTHLAEILSHKDPELAARLRPHIQAYIKDRADFKFADCVPEGYKCDPNLGELFEYEIRPYDDSEPETPNPITPNPTPDPIPVASHNMVPAANMP